MTDVALKFDVAISFLASDEIIALELSAALSGGLTTFVYSERQKEIAGRDGLDEFTRIFRRVSGIVVILHRNTWGATRFTAVEQTAIRERGFQDTTWDFLVVATLDDSPVPDWIPSSRIWVNLARFGVAGLAAVVEERFREQGGTPTVESAVAMAGRIKREEEAETSRLAFLYSQDGVNLAEAEILALHDRMQQLAAECATNVRMLHERRGIDATWLYRCSHTLGVHWTRRFPGSLKDAVLSIETHERRVGPSHYASHKAARLLHEQIVDFNVDVGRLPFWEFRESPRHRYSTADLADWLVKQAINFHEPDETW